MKGGFNVPNNMLNNLKKETLIQVAGSLLNTVQTNKSNPYHSQIIQIIQ